MAKISLKNVRPGQRRSQKQNVMKLIQDARGIDGYRMPLGFGICRTDMGQINKHKVLQCHFPYVNWQESEDIAVLLLVMAGFIDMRSKRAHSDLSKSELVFGVTRPFLKKVLRAMNALANMKGERFHQNLKIVETIVRILSAKLAPTDVFRVVMLFDNAPPQTVEATYLKLMALSEGKAPLRSVNLDGMFDKLQTVAWVNGKPFELEYLRRNQIEWKLTGRYPKVDSIDKFPTYLDHVIPKDGTQIMDRSKVRFGAQLGEGTVVMPASSFVNYNAGTTGAAIVKGRISCGGIIGERVDIGAGACILSERDAGQPITVGDDCVLGTNATVGISFGDGCVIDAGLTVVVGSQIYMAEDELQKIAELNTDIDLAAKVDKHIKKEKRYIFTGERLSGLHGVHYQRDVLAGELTAKRSNRGIHNAADLGEE